MPKSKNRKNHKKKVQARNQRIRANQNRMKKIQREMLEQIMMETQQGKFEDTEKLPDVEGSETTGNETDSDIGDIELEL
ncbi:MAG: hypothetical protein SLAVMIC_00449 [uncultured marine phage]|uniref:Uncharacterized protein n=1 Tax=uncultured marine phage TaxID=707152 RepID=A0A8D9FQ83_9VIRU|nr:MAG: hypothetical protein SLAVMIC_00449 [uncultured marine phage]